jgi:hypothetical protein
MLDGFIDPSFETQSNRYCLLKLFLYGEQAKEKICNTLSETAGRLEGHLPGTRFPTKLIL